MRGSLSFALSVIRIKRKHLTIVLCVLMVVLSVGVALYPLVSNVYAEKKRSLIHTEYEQSILTMEQEAGDEMLEAAHRYNDSLLPVTVRLEDGSAFSKEALLNAGEHYEELLSLDGQGLMGFLQIPKIQVDLPIYHGTDGATLAAGIGHLLGSSLPVGGMGTHAVLTGHSGLPNDRMLSDLEQLEAGDIFHLKILNSTLSYRVDDIHVVLPEDTAYLAIEPDKDLCTLITCTPFGVNTHRLLVRGSRIEEEDPVGSSMAVQTEDYSPAASTWEKEYIKGILFGVGVLSASLLVVFLTKRIRSKQDA